MQPQVQRSYYFTEKYLGLYRFVSYYYQARAIMRSRASTVLFIGVGDSMIVDLLKKDGGDKVVSLDIDASLDPDVVGDIRSLPFSDNSFDLVCAFEVLEHMPFEDSRKAIAEIARVAKRGAVISVPHRRTGIEFVIKFPFIRSLLKRDYLRLALLFPVRFNGFEDSGQHYWEIDWYTTSLKTFRNALEEFFSIEREETPVLDPYRRFFHLTKPFKNV